MRLILFFVLAVAAWGQTAPTQIRAANVKDPVVTKPSVRITMPNGVTLYAVLDAATLILDMTTTPPTLRATGSATTTTRYFPKTVSLPPMGAGADGAFPLPAGTVEGVYRNGLWLTEGRDYSITDGKLLFVLPCCEADEALAVTLWVTAPAGQ